MINNEITINSAICNELDRIIQERGEETSTMDSYGHVLKTLERAGDAAKEIGSTLKEVWKSLRCGDEDTALVLLGEVRRNADAAAREYIKLAAEARRAEG